MAKEEKRKRKKREKERPGHSLVAEICELKDPEHFIERYKVKCEKTCAG